MPRAGIQPQVRIGESYESNGACRATESIPSVHNSALLCLLRLGDEAID